MLAFSRPLPSVKSMDSGAAFGMIRKKERETVPAEQHQRVQSIE
jgi:hypothetical protein